MIRSKRALSVMAMSLLLALVISFVPTVASAAGFSTPRPVVGLFFRWLPGLGTAATFANCFVFDDCATTHAREMPAGWELFGYVVIHSTDILFENTILAVGCLYSFGEQTFICEPWE